MNKKTSISVLFGLLFLIGLVGLIKVAIGGLDTNPANTKIELYGESAVYDNLSTSDGGVQEVVNVTVAVTGDNANITNIDIDFIDANNYTFIGFTNNVDDLELDNSNATHLRYLQNVTVWGGNGDIATWSCTNTTGILISCNGSADSVLDPNGPAVNRSLIIRFNVTTTTANVENIKDWNITTRDSDGQANTTSLYSFVDNLAPRIISLNVTDGNVTWFNDSQTHLHYEVDGNNALTVNVEVQELSAGSNNMFIVVSSNGTNVTAGEIQTFTHNAMTQSIAPGFTNSGVFTYIIPARTADGNPTTFILSVNDSYNNLEVINGSGSDPFAFHVNSTLVKVVGFNITTNFNDVATTLTVPTDGTPWIAATNATIEVVISGEYKGTVEMWFNETGSQKINYANAADLSESVRPEDLWVGLEADHPTNRNLTAVDGSGTAIYTTSIDFSGNHSNNPSLLILVNSTNSSHGDNVVAVNQYNYSSFALYSFRVDGDTGKPIVTGPTDSSVTISSTTGITLTCKASEPDSGVREYKWTLTKPDSTTVTYTDSSTASQLDRAFSGNDINKAGTSSVTCRVTDTVGNQKTSDSYTFSTNYATTASSSGGGGGGGSSTTPTVSFDVDFSEVTVGSIKAQQGLIKSFSFDGSTKHTITFDKVTATSATVTIASNPITLTLNIGQTKEIDINLDGVNDVKVTLKSVVNGLADVEIVKIEAGAQAVVKEERVAAGITEPEPTTTPEEVIPTPVERSNTGLWITALVILVVVVIGYLSYRKK